ncbi:MAG: hypothetical protein AB1609_20615 [Bacillota bacterium]
MRLEDIATGIRVRVIAKDTGFAGAVGTVFALESRSRRSVGVQFISGVAEWFQPSELELAETVPPTPIDPSGRRLDVFRAIQSERRYQDAKWGSIDEHPHSVGEWLLILGSELNEAMDAWVRHGGDRDALREILQVAAVAVACLEQHGVVEREEVRSRAA